MEFTVSGREKAFIPEESVASYIKRVYRDIRLDQVESIFAFTERSTLYGGRPFLEPNILHKDIQEMYELGIGYRIPLTNNYATRAEYECNLCFLEKYHRKGNSVILVNDELGGWIKQDFPQYRVEASIIKNIHTYKQIDEAFELYDTVVLPTSMNEELEFLDGIEQKNRITLFAYAGCGVNCPSKICYPAMSRFNKYVEHVEMQCSQPLKKREYRGKVDFDLNLYEEMGFHRFKLIEPRAAVRPRRVKHKAATQQF